ncbi:ABC transporter permease subunit [Marinobacter lutaoensis]|uniref:Oligopeptide transport system permease protein OppC n=1 Tax=Marinobacter lutaoensis TaxID=135739 RepID=A0A1V2DSW4_9GAMM|nr:ABC transporter permease subunit [Marinobacter lutaoensis]MBE02890.1 peptide ABC transporter permease [Marinobacter sp.]MBI42225.1 peptide ABC transporter permease [Oceanospirillales bacterium]ONF43702.1 peptide ABC transporter permease [Marinobacter lutaoensis]
MTTATATATQTVRGESLIRDAMRRLVRNRATMVSLILLALIVLASFLGPVLLGTEIDDVYWDYMGGPPTWDGQHWFGTDSNGRDLLIRTLYGGQISLTVALVATFVSLIIGVTYGAISGYVGGRTDNLMMRFVDILYSLPFMFLVILMMVVFGRSILLIYIAIGAVEWLDMARIVRGQTLALKRREFVAAAHALGVSDTGILLRHIVPNAVGPVIVYVTLTVPKVILLESFLSFLGLGVQEPMTSWGVLISEGTASMESAPWMLFFPALFLAVTLFCLNFIGDGLRDALDPKTR